MTTPVFLDVNPKATGGKINVSNEDGKPKIEANPTSKFSNENAKFGGNGNGPTSKQGKTATQPSNANPLADIAKLIGKKEETFIEASGFDKPLTLAREKRIHLMFSLYVTVIFISSWFRYSDIQFCYLGSCVEFGGYVQFSTFTRWCWCGIGLYFFIEATFHTEFQVYYDSIAKQNIQNIKKLNTRQQNKLNIQQQTMFIMGLLVEFQKFLFQIQLCNALLVTVAVYLVMSPALLYGNYVGVNKYGSSERQKEIFLFSIESHSMHFLNLCFMVFEKKRLKSRLNALLSRKMQLLGSSLDEYEKKNPMMSDERTSNAPANGDTTDGSKTNNLDAADRSSMSSQAASIAAQQKDRSSFAIDSTELHALNLSQLNARIEIIHDRLTMGDRYIFWIGNIPYLVSYQIFAFALYYKTGLYHYPFLDHRNGIYWVLSVLLILSCSRSFWDVVAIRF